MEIFGLTNVNLNSVLSNIFSDAMTGTISWDEYDFLFTCLRETNAKDLAKLIDEGLLLEPGTLLINNYTSGVLSTRQYLELTDRLDKKQHARPMGFVKAPRFLRSTS
jgi:hypothetical protein